MSRTAAEQASSEEFYSAVLRLMNDSQVPYLVGGTCAVNEYTGLGRPTKDLDVFCRAGDYPKLLSACAAAGYEVGVEDERWIAKISRGDDFCDVVFGSANMVAPVTDLWFSESFGCEMYDVPVKLLAPTELIWSKVFIMDRYKFDGNDVAHIILKKHEQVDWHRLLAHHEQHWEVLYMHLLRFRYIYPSERRLIPPWVMGEMLERLRRQEEMPISQVKSCRGRMFSRDDFLIDIAQWGFADVVGAMGEFAPAPEPEKAERTAAPVRRGQGSRRGRQVNEARAGTKRSRGERDANE